MAKRNYIQTNKDWLKGKAQDEGVLSLDKGIYYKIIKGVKTTVCIPHLTAL